jgi:protein-disulfide isomerase
VTKLAHKQVVDADQNLATDVEARGTPHFFVNGRRLSGAQPLESFERLVDERLAAARALVRSGVPRAKIYETTLKDARGPAPPPTKSVQAPSASTPSRGAKNAPVVIQVFSDFECPFCARVTPTLEQVEREFRGRVRIAWRHLPLPFHKKARLAAAAATEAFAQGGSTKFWKMHDLLFADQKHGLDRDRMINHARTLGLDVARFTAALDDGRHDTVIDGDLAIADRASIRGTPGFVINGYWVSGAQPLATFRRVVQRALDDVAKGKKP